MKRLTTVLPASVSPRLRVVLGGCASARSRSATIVVLSSGSMARRCFIRRHLQAIAERRCRRTIVRIGAAAHGLAEERAVLALRRRVLGRARSTSSSGIEHDEIRARRPRGSCRRAERERARRAPREPLDGASIEGHAPLCDERERDGKRRLEADHAEGGAVELDLLLVRPSAARDRWRWRRWCRRRAPRERLDVARRVRSGGYILVGRVVVGRPRR